MKFRRLIRRRIRRQADGVQIASDVNAVISANVGGRGSSTHVSSSQAVRAEQRRATPEPPEERKEETSS